MYRSALSDKKKTKQNFILVVLRFISEKNVHHNMPQLYRYNNNTFGGLIVRMLRRSRSSGEKLNISTSRKSE